MELLGKLRLTAFAEMFPRCREPFQIFAYEVREASWTRIAEVKARYQSATVEENDHVVFPFVGGLYLVETQIRFDKGLMKVERAWQKNAKTSRRSSLN